MTMITLFLYFLLILLLCMYAVQRRRSGPMKASPSLRPRGATGLAAFGGGGSRIKVDRIIGPSMMFYYKNVFNKTELWLFGERHDPYNKDTCSKPKDPNAVIMNIVDIFKQMIKDKNTYILIEGSNLEHESYCLRCADKQKYSTLKGDLTKFKILYGPIYKDRIIFGDDIRHLHFYHLMTHTILGCKPRFHRRNAILYIEYIKEYKTLKDLFDYFVKTVRNDPTYKEMYNKSPPTLQKHIDDFIKAKVVHFLDAPGAPNYERIRKYFLTLDLDKLGQKEGKPLQLENEKIYTSIEDSYKLFMCMLHTVASDMYTIMFIYNKLKGKRVICYNGGSHTTMMKRFLCKYYHPPDKEYSVPKDERIDEKCLYVPNLVI